jgi:hypothetical protein
MIQQVSYQILKGLIKAQQEYIKWSGGAFLSAFGPEHLATAYSFDFLKKIKPTPKYLVPEMLMETLRDDSGYDGYKTGRLYGNCDIAVYMKNQPTYVIELKRNSKINELTKDIDRITKLLKNKNCSIKAGFIGFIIESSKQINKKVDLQKILKDKINNILEDRKDQLNKKFKDFKINVSDSYYDLKTIDKESNKLWGWSAIVLTITT